jgi:glycerol-3-phosphate cytidylyltransferase
MSSKILTTKQAIEIAQQINSSGKKIVLVGGCFDILHIGHITFLENSKKQGNILFILLENDKTIKKLKGDNRPVNSQEDRSQILAHLSMVDYVVMLPEIIDDKTYDKLVIDLKPAIIATTAGDINKSHKERQAKLVGAKIIDVTNEISNKSTTRLVNILHEI